MTQNKLSDNYDFLVERKDISLAIEDIPRLIKENINPNFALREYQINSMARFIAYYEKEPQKSLPIQLLFNMATGSGKTLIMVMAMLYLYDRGYRNFVFFVDKSNIVKKTIENFINKGSSKYLFHTEKMVMDGQEVFVKQVESFAESSKDAINIHFSTIAGLHGKLKNPKENAVHYADFEGSKTVFISDEAHHINAETKSKKTKTRQKASPSWEDTVERLVACHRENVLLEFTATIDWEDAAIFEKYKDRVLFEYDLKRFREDRYSKDVFLLQSDGALKDRMLQAVIVSQYRRKIAAEHNIALKPVILMKSKYANEGKRQAEERLNTSAQNRELFIDMIQNLRETDLEKNLKIAQASESDILFPNENIFKSAFSYFQKEDFANLIQELQIEFSGERVLDISDDKRLEENQIKINSLEDESNEVRVVFAVDKLNEGWDVLNLFDIVRLYGTRDTGKATTAEAQLVGRGARYFPFAYKNFEDTDRRKFDADERHALRIIEQLHFHSEQNHRYINELREALIKSGIHKHKGREITLRVKDSFKETRLFQKGYIWQNERIRNKRKNVRSLADYYVERLYKINVGTGSSVSSMLAFSGNRAPTQNTQERTINRKMADLPVYVVRKALDKIPFFYFRNLQCYFPHISSIKEFIRDTKYLGGIVLEIKTTKERPSPIDIFPKLLQILEKIKNTIKQNSSEFMGDTRFHSVRLNEVVEDKTMYIEQPAAFSNKEFGRSMKKESRNPLDLSRADFYAYDDDYGTDEEKHLVRMIYDNRSQFSRKYKEFHLLRNQKIMELFDFEKGRRFEPDYLLFLGTTEGEKTAHYYQLFIEPKGEYLEDGEKWKEDFLGEIKLANEVMELFENEKYTVYGLPFYRESQKLTFQKELENLIGVKLTE